MKKSVLFLLVSIFAVQASAAEPNFYIIHGFSVRADDPIASTTVAIVNQSGGRSTLCTGSIVAADLVVTAAHCVGPERDEMHLVFARNIHQAEATVIPVAGYLRSKKFGKNVGEEDLNDIALIRFEGGLPPGYGEARLLEDEALLKNGKQVTLAGFGVSDGRIPAASENSGAGVLRKVKVRIAQAAYGKTEVALDQTQGRGACHGDSGGPAFLKLGKEYLLFGVTSRGISARAEECGGNTIYTNILAQSKFLKRAADHLRKGQSLP